MKRLHAACTRGCSSEVRRLCNTGSLLRSNGERTARTMRRLIKHAHTTTVIARTTMLPTATPAMSAACKGALHGPGAKVTTPPDCTETPTAGSELIHQPSMTTHENEAVLFRTLTAGCAFDDSETRTNAAAVPEVMSTPPVPFPTLSLMLQSVNEGALRSRYTPMYTPPPLLLAVFPEILQLLNDGVPEPTYTPPPLLLAVFPEIVQLLNNGVPELTYAPPPPP